MSEVTVYLVDDDPSFLVAMSRLLKASGFHVSAHDSSVQFLRNLPRDARGCIVADLEMPGLNGLELHAELVDAGVTMPVIFLTAHGDIPTSVRAMRGGASDFLEKRAPKDETIAAIRTALEHDAAQHAARLRARELEVRFTRLT